MRDLVYGPLDESLSAKSRIHGHYQDQVQVREHFLKDMGRRSRIDRDACLHAKLFDQMDDPMKMRAGLGMNGDQVSSSLDEVRNIQLRLFNHQMHVKRQARMRPDGLDDRWAQRNIRYKVSVHDIHMNPPAPPASASLISCPSFAKSADNMDGAIFIIIQYLRFFSFISV